MIYFYSPSKKGLSGFFNKERFLILPNLSKDSSKNCGKSLKLFLLAENVSKCFKTGKSAKDWNILSSITKVTKFKKGANYIPKHNWLKETSKCWILTPVPKLRYFSDFKSLPTKLIICKYYEWKISKQFDTKIKKLSFRYHLLHQLRHLFQCGNYVLIS